MTQLTEHEKSILKAIIDDKQIEGQIRRGGEWYIVSRFYAMRELENPNVELRIKPETRSINGVEFAAPITGDGFELNISTGASYLDNRCFVFARSEDRNTAYRTFVDALGGKNHAAP